MVKNIVLWNTFWMPLGKCKMICDEHSGIIYKTLFLEECILRGNTVHYGLNTGCNGIDTDHYDLKTFLVG